MKNLKDQALRGRLNLKNRFPRKVLFKPMQEELGFGKNVTTQGRLMNQDGTFNVVRDKSGHWDNTYYTLISMPWRYFSLLVFGSYLVLNLIFAGLYLWVGIDEMQGAVTGHWWHEFTTAFFFSSQTLTTVGYGAIAPKGVFASSLAALESFFGLLAFALISGLLYGRFSRSSARIVFSENMLVAPYKESKALMFRMINARRSEIIEAEVQAILAINQFDETDQVVRRFFPVPLEVNKISFFSLSWTLVHHINESSPFYGFSEQELLESNAEVLVLVKGVDEANQQTVHTRTSYTAAEFIWNARFKPVINRNEHGIPHVHTKQVGDYEVLEG